MKPLLEGAARRLEAYSPESGRISLIETAPRSADEDLYERLDRQTKLREIETPRGTIRKIEFREEREPISVETFKEAVQQAGEEMDARLRSRFGPDGLVPMHKHAPEHSLEEVEGGTIRILDAINDVLVEAYGSSEAAHRDAAYSNKERLCVALLAARTHDSVQNHIVTKDANGHEIIQRYRGAEGLDVSEQVGDPRGGFRSTVLAEEMTRYAIRGNEYDSADELKHHLQRYQYEDGRPVFSEEALASIHPDIAATYPNFTFHPETGLKVFQPYLSAELNPDKTIAGFAIAHADLRSLLAQESSKGFEDGGDAELRETKPWMFALLDRGFEGASDKQLRQCVQETLGWLDTQISFAAWQKKLLIESIATDVTIARSSYADRIRARMHELFRLAPGEAFDRNIEAAKNRAQRTRGRYQDLLATDRALSESERARVKQLLLEVSGERE